MCAGALIQARVGRVIYAAADAKRGALGGCLDLAHDPSAHHHMAVQAGLLAAPAERLLSDWFLQRRQARRKRPEQRAEPRWLNARRPPGNAQGSLI
jgi:tRNA(adenine34) deaminase